MQLACRKNVELPSARMSFGIGVSKTQSQLLEEINAALDSLKDGTLRKIYSNWESTTQQQPRHSASGTDQKRRAALPRISRIGSNPEEPQRAN
jgi:hypothetical protein